MLITPKDLGPLRIMLNLHCLYSTNGTRPGWQHICFQYSILLRTTAEGKKNKDFFPGHPGELMEMYNEINVAYMPANTTSIL